ncbi:MAG: response regulator [Verrucomicrobia bacterium]|nr:response regulator [Verrucomicrobiota bacterium]MBI3870185.1 response regulator [Verrucomicrobiota bacterium]
MRIPFASRQTRPLTTCLLAALSVAGSAAAQAPLTTTQSVQNLTEEQASEHGKVRLRGVVTFSHEPWRLLFVEDSTGGIYCEPPVNLRLPLPGAEVEVLGHATLGNFQPYVAVRELREISAKPLPPGRPVTDSELWNGLYDADMVRLRAQVVGAGLTEQPKTVLQLRLTSPKGETRFSIIGWEGPIPDDILGATIEATGVFAPQANSEKKVQTITLFGAAPSSLRIVTGGREAAGTFARTSLADFRAREPLAGIALYRLGGGVTLRDTNEVYLGEGGVGVELETPQGNSLSEGQRVEALVVNEPGTPEKRCELVRLLSVTPGNTEPPTHLKAEDLADWRHYGQVVEVEGEFLHRIPMGEGDLLVMRAGQTSYEIRLRFALDQKDSKVAPGSIVRATGVLRLRSTPGAAQPTPRILVSQPQGLRVIAPPPWSMQKTLSVVALLSMSLALGLIALGVAHQRLRLSNHQVARTEEEVKRLNADLERRIHQRTQELEVANQRLQSEALERKSAEAALLDRETRLRQAQSIARLGSFHWDSSRNILSWSEELFRVFGQDPVSFVPSFKALIEQVVVEDRSGVEACFAKTLATGANLSHEYRIVRPNQEVRWVSALGCVFFDAAGLAIGITGTCQDVTDRKREASLREEQTVVLEMIAKGSPLPQTLERLVLGLESHGAGMICSILLLDEDGKHLRHGAAPSLPDEYNAKIDGYAIGPCAGSCGTAAFRSEPVIVADIETDPLWKDVRHLALEIGVRACWSTPILDEHRRVLGTVAIYYRVPGPPPREHQRLVEVATHTAAICISKGRAEKTQDLLEAELRQSQKMEAIGTLAGGIAHDFNNILGAIMGYASLARMDATNPVAVGDHLDQLLLASHRAKELIKHMLTFSRRDERKREPLPLEPVLNESMGLLRAALPPHVELNARVRSPGLWVVGNGTQIQQVIMNLATNAAQAIGQAQGRIDVELSLVPAAETAETGVQTLPEGPLARLTISDTGPGIPPEVQDRVFEPFFTTKRPGHGTGLGLSVVHGIVQAHGGSILLRPRAGRGAIFDVYLPAVATPGANAPSQTDPNNPASGTERILLVDDEPALLRVGESLLRRLGYRVTACEDPQKALSLFRKSAEEFDLVITDQSMPGLTGVEFAQRISKERPGMPIILCTGHGAGLDYDRVRQHGLNEVLEKPVESHDLHRAIRAALDHRTTPGASGPQREPRKP